MTVTCEITEESCSTEKGSIFLYGLDFYRSGESAVFCSIGQITADRSELERLRARINAGDLDEIHIFDVLDDALAEWEALPL